MSSPDRQEVGLTDEQAVRVWAVYFKRWGELLHDQVLADAERCKTLDRFEQSYLRAFWQGVSRKLRRLNLRPETVPATTVEELDAAWKTIRQEFGFPLTDEAIAPDVERRLKFLKRKVAQRYEQSVGEAIDRHKVVSPIEQIFLIYWKFHEVENLHGLVLQPQAPITTERNTYKVDFLVAKKDGPAGRVAIELDGHEFHERTQAQAIRDKSRERAIVAAGVPLLRFTGSEVFNNPRLVIDEIVKFFNAAAA